MSAWSKLHSKQLKIERQARLRNWGRWARSGNHGLGYSTWAQVLKHYLGDPSRGQTVDELDAEILEHCISTLDLIGRAEGSLLEVQAFVLRLEYVETPDSRHPAQEQKAKDVSRKFKRPCSTRTYRQHLYNARKAVFTLIGDL